MLVPRPRVVGMTMGDEGVLLRLRGVDKRAGRLYIKIMAEKAHSKKGRAGKPVLPALLKAHPLTGWLAAKGWHWHPHQIEVLEAARSGHDVLLMAPTGAGKTLAGFLPSIIDLTSPPPARGRGGKGGRADVSANPSQPSPSNSPSRRQEGENKKAQEGKIHTLYISPLKALAVDVHRNLTRPIEDINLPLTVETRTGDTPAAKRQRQKTKPPQMLMTTPESLALLISYEEAADYFSGLRYIVVDELHAIMHSKRGDLLSLALARLDTIAPQACRIGLSATLDDAATAEAYFCRPQRGAIVRAPERIKPDIEILRTDARMPWSGHMATYALPDVYARLKDAKMAVVFVNTRAQAELIFQELWRINDDNLKIALHHGSLERDLRRKVEQQMAAGTLDCVVATSSLDLGLDWADVDLVVQIGAPKGVSRLLQRIGRSNHRLDAPSRALLVPASRFEYLECVAAMDAIRRGELDGPVPRPGGLDVLAQHIFGSACNGPFDPMVLYDEVRKAWPYRNLTSKDFADTLKFVQDGGYALKAYDRFARLKQDDDGRYGLSGPAFLRQYRMNIGTIVEAPMLKVVLRNKTLGKIEEWFVQGLSPGDTFLFSGRVLRYDGLRDMAVMVSVTKDSTPKIPSYDGGKLPLSTHLSIIVRALLNNPRDWDEFPEGVGEWLRLQQKCSMLPSTDGLLVETFARGGRFFLVAYCFEGRAAHQTLGFLLARRMQRFGYRPLGFVATDYALACWSLKEPTDINGLFSEDIMTDDLAEWMQDTPLLKRLFRDAAVIGGLIERRHPGHQKTGKQMTFNSDLIYEVLRKYEPDHVLLRAAHADASGGLVDLERLGRFLLRVQGHITHLTLKQVSPLSVPLLLEISRETIHKDVAGEYYLQDLERELLTEAGFDKTDVPD
jgi:ATP-dependent Lhr-like helicase